jgi:hypothetical protein
MIGVGFGVRRICSGISRRMGRIRRVKSSSEVAPSAEERIFILHLSLLLKASRVVVEERRKVAIGGEANQQMG